MRSQVTACSVTPAYGFGLWAARGQAPSGAHFQLWIPAFAVMTLMVAALPTLPARAEAPKSGGTLTYVIAADAPPSFDAHREATFATVYSGAPFYSVLIRVDRNNPSSNDFVCDLCTEMPTLKQQLLGVCACIQCQAS